MLKPFIYPLPSKRIEPPRVMPINPVTEHPDEGLTGWVNGIRASDLEERFSRELRKKRLGFAFQHNVRVENRGYKNTIDFVVDTGFSHQAVEVFGPFTHGDALSEKDAARLAEINPALMQQGIEPVIVVWHWEISTPELARNKVDELFF